MTFQQTRSVKGTMFFLILFLCVAVPGLPTLRAQNIISTVAGDGASLNGPTGVAVDGAGNLFIADTFNSRIRKIAPAP